jgi:transcriptional regulator with XRE-family HTH domain
MMTKPIDLLVGARLERLREAQAMALSDVSLAIGASAAHIAEYERGARRVPAESLLALAGLFGVGLEALFPPGAQLH